MAGELLRVRLQPRAGREEVVGERGGAIVIRVKAPPVEGHANLALRRLVAKRAGVPRAAVEIVRGAGGREKLVRVEGRDAAAVQAALLDDMAGS